MEYRRSDMSIPVIMYGAVAFGLAAAVDQGFGSDATAVAILATAAAAHVGVGWIAARVLALCLPLLGVLVALPFGFPDDVAGEPLPVWADMVVYAPFAAALIGVGVVARKAVVLRWRRP